MTDPFASRPVDYNAVDLAWARYITRDMSRFDAVLEMTLVGTGHPLPERLKPSRWHWGTAIDQHDLVWHLVEVWPS